MATFREVLENPTVQQVHYQPKRTFLPIIGEHGAWQMDLMFLEDYAHQNKGYNGILTLVNIPSRYGVAVPIKGKNDTLRAFKDFMEEARRNKQDVVRIESDNGGEFLNRPFEAYLKAEGIKHTTSAPGDHRKQGIVERFNQTLRGWIERWLTEKRINNWVDVMPQILDYYNTRKHKTTGVAPAEMTEEDENDLKSAQYDATDRARAQINAIKPGDKVRILLHKKAFGKGRLRWSDNVYTIKQRIPNSYSFQLEETDTPQKYSDIQLVTSDSRDVEPKAPETKALAVKREHALRLGRSGLARGPREAEELIAKTPTSAAPLAQQRAPRARSAPAWHQDYQVGPAARAPRAKKQVTFAAPPAPAAVPTFHPPPTAEATYPDANEEFPEHPEPPEPRRSSRIRKPPAHLAAYRL